MILRSRRQFIRMGRVVQNCVDRKHSGGDKQAQKSRWMRDDPTRWPGVLSLRYHFGKSFRDCSKAPPGQRGGQSCAIQMIKAVYARCMNDDMSISMAKNEPRIALVRNPAFGFDGKACLEERMLDAIKFRKLVVRPPACRRRRPRQREYRTTHSNSHCLHPGASPARFYGPNQYLQASGPPNPT